jgi:hypothetical protein
MNFLMYVEMRNNRGELSEKFQKLHLFIDVADAQAKVVYCWTMQSQFSRFILHSVTNPEECIAVG